MSKNRGQGPLRYLLDRGIVPGALLRVAAVNTAADSIAVVVGEATVELSSQTARALRVADAAAAPR